MTADQASWFVREEAIMGTAIRAELRHIDRAAADTALAAVMSEMHRIDDAMSPFRRDSELSHINREAARGPIAISREMFDLLARAVGFSEFSGGAFDITFASVGRLYDYRERRKPSEEALARALPGVNYRHILLDAAACTVAFACPGVHIDLGGIAKGHAVDNCIRLLQARGVREAMVSAGGDSRVLGTRDGRPWIIGIRDPRHADRMIAKLPLVDAAISTSGDYERYFEESGVRHHHILDPRTGRSAGGIRAVTVIGPDTTTTEGVSKAVFIKGVDAGMKLVDSLADVDAVVVDDTGQMYYSRGLAREE